MVVRLPLLSNKPEGSTDRSGVLAKASGRPTPLMIEVDGEGCNDFGAVVALFAVASGGAEGDGTATVAFGKMGGRDAAGEGGSADAALSASSFSPAARRFAFAS